MYGLRQTMLLLSVEAKRLTCKKKGLFLAGMVLMLVMVSTFSYVRGFGQEEVPKGKYITFGIANQDSSEYAALLLNYFKESPDFSAYAEIVEGEETTLTSRFDAGELDCLLVIPEGFAERMIQMEHLPVRVRILTENATKALLLKTGLSAYETYITSVEVNCMALYDRMRADGFSYEELERTNVDISLDLIFTALGKDSFFPRRTVERVQKTGPLTGYLCGLCYLLLLLVYFPVGSKFMEYFKSGMAGRMAVMGVSYAAVSAAVLAPYLLLTFLAAALLLIVAPERTAVFFLTEVFFLLPMLLLFAGFGTACRRKQTYLLLYSLSFVALALLGGTILPELYLPQEFLLVSAWLPNYRFLQLFADGPGGVSRFAIAAAAEVIVLSGLLLFLMKRRGEETDHAD